MVEQIERIALIYTLLCVGVCQGCILPSCLFNLYAEYIMRNARLEEAEAGIKIAWRNIDNLKYSDDLPLWLKMNRN